MSKNHESVLSSSSNLLQHGVNKSRCRNTFTFSNVTEFDRWLTRKLFAIIGYSAIYFKLWNGEEIGLGKKNRQ